MYTNVNSKYYSSINNILSWNPTICNTDKPRGHYAREISQKEEYKYCIISLICGIFKKEEKAKTHSNIGQSNLIQWSQYAKSRFQVHASHNQNGNFLRRC